MPAPTTSGNGPAASGAITRTQSFTPITPVVRERVGEVANRLFEVERIVENINLQSASSAVLSPSIGDLQEDIVLLKKEIDGAKEAQKKQIDDLRKGVKNDVKEQITKSTRAEIDKKVKESIKTRVNIEVADWGQSAETKRFVENLRKMVEENTFLHQEAQVKLDNSRSRYANSTLDEQADFETDLATIKLPNGSVSKMYPRTLKELFSYDEHKLVQLLDDYGLRKLETHLDNLNRFLAFIGLRFSIPEQALDFLDAPPAYPSQNILESSEEAPQVPPPDQGENEAEAMSEVKAEKPPQEHVAVVNNPVQTQTQEQQLDEKQVGEKNEVKPNHGRQKPPGIELSILTRQPSTAAMSPRLQQATPTFPARSIGRGFPPPLPPPPPQPQVGTQVAKGVGGWLKSITDNL